jgi:hypothetical protein
VKKTAPPADWSADNNAADNDDLVIGFHGAQIERKRGQKASANSGARRNAPRGTKMLFPLARNAPERFQEKWTPLFRFENATK